MRKNNDVDRDWFRSKYLLENIVDPKKIREHLAYFFNTGSEINV